jgi:predicted lysophospholipase L1 biosynthesis ABC-type transport system permease subunit
LFQWIALIILVIACINYVNLLTARASKRHREIGLRKIVGARTFGLFLQLMSEAVVLFVFAIFIALLLNMCLQAPFAEISGKEINISLLDGKIWLIYFVMLSAIVVLAGIYPAFMLASFKTNNVLQNVKAKAANRLFRKILVVLQFTASTALITGTIVLGGQMRYMREKDMGYNREQVLTCGIYNMWNSLGAVKAELEKHVCIEGVTVASENIMDISSGGGWSNWEGKTGEGMLMYTQQRADTSYLRVMGLTLVDGTGFTSTTERQYILNETAVKTFGLTEPVGKWMDEPGQKIVGVVKDFHFASLHSEIKPLVIYYEPRAFSRLFIRIAAGRTKDAISVIENVWKQYNPDITFNYSFLDETFDRLYKSDIRTGQLFGIFSIIAVLISCLGLFGLVVFSAELKTKEIGIRKVLGASIMNIINLLTTEFLIMVGIAIVIAIPLAYFWLDNILQDFAYRIPIYWWMFFLAALLTVTLTVLTVGAQALKAAMKNPVDAIKTE